MRCRSRSSKNGDDKFEGIASSSRHSHSGPPTAKDDHKCIRVTMREIKGKGAKSNSKMESASEHKAQKQDKQW